MMREKDIVEDVIRLLSSSRHLAERFSADIKTLEGRARIAQANKYRLAVLGVTSSGKSTMLNAMLGKQLLPSVAIPSSSQLVSCHKGDRWMATVFFENGRQLQFRDNQLTPKIVRDYGEETYNPGNAKKVRQIEICSPTLDLPSDLIIEDSPGLDAYGLEGHEYITMQTLLPFTDFCLFVTTCKTNSDNKMKEVLNEVARYDKPVIIVQNMIDSLQPTPDGSKSVAQVAQDHIRRIKRVIDDSNIIDKSSVHIVQISAIYALSVREFLLKNNGRHNAKSKLRWKESNLETLLNVISNVFDKVKPEVEQKRLISLRGELKVIHDNIAVESNRLNISVQVDYWNVYSSIKQSRATILRNLNNELSSLEDIAKRYSDQSSCSSSDISYARISEKDVVKNIGDIFIQFNKELEGVCTRLNVSTREFAVRVPSAKQFSLSEAYTTETYKVKKSGVWNSTKRFWGFSSGYDTKTKTVSDGKENKRRIIEFLEQSYDDLSKRIFSWETNSETILCKIRELVENKMAQNEAAIRAANQHNLSRQEMIDVKSSLQRIIQRLPLSPTVNSKGLDTDHAARFAVKEMKVSDETFSFIKLGKDLIRKIHQSVWSKIIEDRQCDIITWDYDQTRRFLHQSLGIDYNLNQHSTLLKSKCCSYVRIFDGNTSVNISRGHKVMIMVNATQPGAARKQLNPILMKLRNQQFGNGDLIFIIQDLKEAFTGADLRGSMRFLREYIGNMGMLLPSHANPLYAIAMYEAARRNIILHSDELKLLKELKERLAYLFENDSEVILSDLLRKD